MLSLEMFLLIDSALLAWVWWLSIKDPGDKIDNSLMKAKKVPRERNPFLLTGKRRWQLSRWLSPRTGHDGRARTY
jgi:hypothetical protein